MRIVTTIFILLLSKFIVAQTGSLSGKVIDSRSAEPVPFAAITLSQPVQKGLLGWAGKKTNADDKGNFHVDSLRPGNYSVLVSAVGYPVKSYPFTIVENSIVVLEVDLYVLCKYDAHKKDQACPTCHKKGKVIPIIYGLPVGKMDDDNYYYAGCEITLCDPNWYCKRDKTKF